MIALAARLHPGLDFRQADVHELPFEVSSFDAVVGNFLILHLGRPEQAMAGFVSMLRPGGRLALTAWDLPERARFLGVFLDAVAEAGATAPEDLPAGPDFFRFSVDEEFDALLRDHGLENRTVRTIAFTHRVATPMSFGRGSSEGASESPRSSSGSRTRPGSAFATPSIGSSASTNAKTSSSFRSPPSSPQVASRTQTEAWTTGSSAPSSWTTARRAAASRQA